MYIFCVLLVFIRDNGNFYYTYVLMSIFLVYKFIMRNNPKSIASSDLNITIAAPADIMNCLLLPENHPSYASNTENCL